jgi:hypothetical protein
LNTGRSLMLMRRYTGLRYRRIRKEAEHIVSNIVVLKSNPHYRVADILYKKGLRHEESAEKVLSLDEFKGTLLREYLKRNNGYQKINIPLFSDIIVEHLPKISDLGSRPDEVALHIRAGDVVVHDWFLQTDFKKLVEQSGCRNCVLVTAFSFSDFKERNWWVYSEEKMAKNRIGMIEFLSRLLNDMDHINFRISSNYSVDRDFITMVMADEFVQDFGGFSQLVADVRRHRGLRPSMNPSKAEELRNYTIRNS